ncbi:methyltransferase domain-containing protein [Albidovulum sediminicola]|uniref:Methyltransferase domain-containing protein n=1 Tax=Albidovulum sediminicola TaxID=2984331 RepID=A0ABT2YWH8_9RHOB|nr:methyltransferase domain-containing protein [Defluviimonas sp. WL0075]MCV2863224.1 methyltransferase domain-containing protein [Defluviimonas sp. WL0075]
MQTPPLMTDAAALARNRARALRQGAELFLQEEAADEIKERLGEVNRRFTKPLIVSGFAEPWQSLWPGVPRVADADLLQVEPGAHDLVIHAFGLHWANDPVGQLVQCRRALSPDGLFMAVLFGGRSLSELRAVLAEAESRASGGLSLRVLPMAEIRDLGGLLQRAGFALPVADSAVKTVTYRTAFHLIADLRAMGEGNALAARSRRWPGRALFPEAARLYAETFPADDDRIRATFEMIFLTGWAPHESQQKPLRPGSAVQRLSEALGIGGDNGAKKV